MDFSRILFTTEYFLRRDLKTRYADSLLGSIWMLIYPLAFTGITVSIFTFAFPGEIAGVPYFLYVFLGFTSWLWFSQTIIYSCRSLVSNRELIINNQFPIESIVYSTVLAKSIDYSITLIVFFICFLFMGYTISLPMLVLFFFVTTAQLIFQIGISLIVSTANVYYRDVQHILDISQQLLFYATPIIYPIELVPNGIQKLLSYNPMTHYVSAYRQIIFSQKFTIEPMMIIAAFSALIFFLGYIFFIRIKGKLAEII